MRFFEVTDTAIAGELLELDKRRKRWRLDCLKFFAKHGFSRTDLGIDGNGYAAGMLTSKTRGRSRQPDLSAWKTYDGQFYRPKARTEARKGYYLLGPMPSHDPELETRVGFKSTRRWSGTAGAFQATTLGFQVLPGPKGRQVVVLATQDWSEVESLKGCRRMSDVKYESLLKQANEKAEA